MFQQVQERLQPVIDISVPRERYRESVTEHRLGQGAFWVVATEAYQRRCAITGEKTLPVLEAAYIKPYASDGPHSVNNGLLLKSDFHTLFDGGNITIDQDYRIDVSRRLHEDYGNGRDYYKFPSLCGACVNRDIFLLRNFWDFPLRNRQAQNTMSEIILTKLFFLVLHRRNRCYPMGTLTSDQVHS